jgi:rhodanese-related sulfurtransferase
MTATATATASAETLPPLSGDTPMGELLQLYPGAQRALFAKYHIGGCRSCGFQPTETLAQVCERNENIPVAEAVGHIQESHQADASIQISPLDFAKLRSERSDVKVLDVRTREEHEAVAIPGAELVTQELVQEVFTSWDKQAPLIIYDHTGERALDATAYFLGHGFAEAKCLTGGIDAYSVEVDPALPRYRVEME